MEELLKLLTAIEDKSLGVLSFLALMFAGYKILQFLEQVRGDIRLMKDNHLPHVQAALERVADGIEELLRIHKKEGP